MNLNKRYQQPRKAQQDNNVFDDKRTGRKVYNNYSGNVFKNPSGVRAFMKEMQSYKKKI